jgi:hypothetical protein
MRSPACAPSLPAALTTPALLSQRERREKSGRKQAVVVVFSPLSLRERGAGGVRASKVNRSVPPLPLEQEGPGE